LVNRRILFAVPLVLAAVAAVKYRARRIPWTWQPDTIEEEATERPEIAPISPVRGATPSLFTLLSSSVGLACFITAHWLLLQSRHPIAPLTLYILGFVFVIPLLSFYESSWSHPVQKRHIAYQSQINPRWSYLIAAAFFAAVGMLAAQTGTINPLLVFSWLMSVVLTANALLGNERLVSLPNLTPYAREIVGILALMFVAAFMLAQLPTPTSLNSNDANLVYDSLNQLYIGLTSGQQLSNFLAVLLIPVVYLLGRIVGGALLGIFAAGFAAVSGWTLALGKLGGVYSLLALVSVLTLAALIHAERTRSRAGYIWLGILLGLGWAFSPQFIYMILLILLAALCVWLDERRDWKPIVINHALALLMLVVVALPFAATGSAQPVSPDLTSGLDPLTDFADGLSSSLLIFNLTSDPSPFHGIVNRPAFSPVLAAAFVMGLLGLVWRASHSRRWVGAMLPIALIVCLLSSAVSPAYPDLQRASVALPVALVIAASGLALLAHLFTLRWNKVGLAIVSTAYLLALTWTMIDTQTHYTRDFLPAYEQAARAYVNLEAGR
jgi:hypothetical protein